MAQRVEFTNPNPQSLGGALKVTFQIDNPQVLNEWLGVGEQFKGELEKTFTGFVFEVHKYLIRITPIDTGELRGGWTSWLDRNQIDYSRQLFDTSIAEKAPGRDYHITPEGVEEGKQFSQFEAPNPLDITIINDVPYGIFLEMGTSRMAARNFVEQARFKAEFLFEETFNNWFRKIESTDDVVEADPPQEAAA